MTNDYEIVLRKGRVTKLALAAFAIFPLTANAHPGPHGVPAGNPSAATAANVVATAPVAIVDAFHAALTSGDTRAALDLLAEDVLIFESGGVERGRAEYASHHLAADAAFSAAVRRTRVSRSQGE